MSLKPFALATIGAAVMLAQVAAPDVSHAKPRSGKQLIERSFTFKGPVRGYSGFAGGYYCDYQRVPNRQCVITASGDESCKIVNWTLKQVCY